MSSLSFIPRKLNKGTNAQKTKAPDVTTKVSTAEAPASTTSSGPEPLKSSSSSGPKQDSKLDEQDYASLIALSLSDYALWLDPDLRQKLGTGSQPGSADDLGYVSLNFLLEHSTVLSYLTNTQDKMELKAMRSKIQSALIRGIRLHASHLFDVRLLLHADETIPRFGKQKEVGGGYEIRRKRVGLVLKGKSEWDASTLYMENIPPGYRTHADIIRFLNSLLFEAPSPPSSSVLPLDPMTRIQGISFPPHHSDKPGAKPSFKGFALVTFSHLLDCEYIKERWPWSRDQPVAKVEPNGKTDAAPDADASHAAHQYRFRVMAKERWLQMKAEYLTYRQKLIDEMNAYQDARHLPPSGPRGPSEVSDANSTRVSAARPSTHTLPSLPHGATANPTPSLSAHSLFPPNCLVFVKNIHPETTKTTLRKLFSQAFKAPDAGCSLKNGNGLDYVDFNKGMDTCYLRLATPAYTAALATYFDHGTRKVVQSSGMDEEGRDIVSAPQGLKPIAIERVVGRPEEIYWEKVPAKVKKTAVEKAVELLKTGDGDRGYSDTREGKRTLEDTSVQKDETFSRKKKRRL